MIRTVDRYVTREFTRLFVLGTLGLPFLFVLGDWTEQIEAYTERRISPFDVALGYFYQMPLFISYALPVAALFATVFTVNAMTRHSEMTAAKAGGISFFRTLITLPLLGILVTVLGLVMTELVPHGTTRQKELVGEVEPVNDLMRHDFVYAGERGSVYTIRRLMMSGPSLGLVTIEQPARGDAPAVHITAREAIYDSIGWKLREGIHRTLAVDKPEVAFRFGELRLKSFTETPEQLMARAKEPEEMRYDELGRFIETLERSGAQPLELKVKRAQKIAIPVATFVIVLFGAPLANSSSRGGAAYGIGVSLGITIIYMMLFRLMAALGETGTLSPEMAAWAPNIIFFIAAVLLLFRVRS